MPGGALDQESLGPSSSSSSSPSSSSSTFVGETLDTHRGAFVLSYPMDHGHLLLDDATTPHASPSSCLPNMERLIQHIYSKSHLHCKPDQHPILLTEAPLNPRSNREALSELFFETLRAPAIFFSPPAVLSLYASGRATGVVLDVGEGVTHCIPVYEGYALVHSMTRSDVAGRDVTKRLQLLLRKSGLAFSTTAECDLVKNIKEDVCFVQSSSQQQQQQQQMQMQDGRDKGSTTSSSSKNATTTAPTNNANDMHKAIYQLPDGQTVQISQERYMAPEILFQPSLIGSEEVGVANALVDSIMKSDLDLRPTLFSQIVLAGGSTCLPGFGDRLLEETRRKCPVHTRIRISAPPERVYSAWAGGSILASLATFKDMWVTREEYEEHGCRILHSRLGL
jgi:Actin and related proteins